MRSSLVTAASKFLLPVKALARGAGDLIYPPRCLLCNESRSPADTDFCRTCKTSLLSNDHETCPRCAGVVGPYSSSLTGCVRCKDGGFHFDQTIRMGPYADKRREAVLRMKHYLGEGLAAAMGTLWAEPLRQRLHGTGVDWIVPVPLHWIRRLSRGYNQSQAVAVALSRKLGIPCRPRWLRRKRNTPHQMGQSVAVRRANVRGAFESARRPALNQSTVLLVDDVMTTGSTASEAARMLKKAGASRIIVTILARVES